MYTSIGGWGGTQPGNRFVSFANAIASRTHARTQDHRKKKRDSVKRGNRTLGVLLLLLLYARDSNKKKT